MPLYLRAGVGPIRYSGRLTGNRKRRPARPVTRGAHIAGCVFAALVMGALGIAAIANGSASTGVTILVAGALVVLVQLAKTPRR